MNDALKSYLLTVLSVKLIKESNEVAEEISEWRSLLVSLFDLSYPKACESILQFVSHRYSVSSLAWLEQDENNLKAVFAKGRLYSQQIQLSIAIDDKRLLDTVKSEVSLELPEQENTAQTSAPRIINFFPIAIGGEIPRAIIISDELLSEDIKQHILRFCQAVALELEVLRLREELNRHNLFKSAVQKFNEQVEEIDAPDFWLNLVHICAELIRAERGSLLIFDEKSNSLVAKATTAACADGLKREKEKLGERIARKVLQTGNPLDLLQK